MDEHGYPDKNELETIKNWQMQDGWHELMKYVRERWAYSDYFRSEGNTYFLSTAGWSGNEDLIQALNENFMFWSICWQSSRRGGHYEFTVYK